MSAASPFLERFNNLVATLRAHPEVEVFDVVVRPPASADALRDAEDRVGRMPDDLRAFYAAHDGVFLEWGVRGKEYDPKTEPFAFPDYGHPPGCINLLPVGVAMSRSWEECFHVNEIQADHQRLLFGEAFEGLPVKAVCVDNFAKYNHGDLVFGPEPVMPVMVVSTDHGADMDSSDFCSFSLYLEITLANFAANRYYHGLGCGWGRKPQRVTEWTKQLSLDALVAELRAE